MIAKGYISSRHFSGGCIPQRVQNLVIRDHAQRHNLAFSFSAVEYNIPGCWMMLQSLAREEHLDALIFYSVWQLLDSPSRPSVLEVFLDKGIELHFSLEDRVISSRDDMAWMDDLVCADHLSRQSQITLDHYFGT